MAYAPAEGVAGMDRTRVLPSLTSIDTSSSSKNEESSSSVSSPTPLTSSKTAAFFGTNGGNTVRPSSHSVSSGSSSYTSPPRERHEDLDEVDGPASSSGLSRFGSWRGSQRSSRRWDTFEGKPVTPLPSPALQDDESYPKRSYSGSGSNVFDSDFERKARGGQSGNSSRNSSQERHSQLGGFDISISESFSSLPSFSSRDALHIAGSHAEPHHESKMSSSSSKTKNFFGTSKVATPTSSKPSSPHSRTKRLPSERQHLFEPSRLPSAPYEWGDSIPGVTASSSANVTPTPAGHLSQFSSGAEMDANALDLGIQAHLLPVATISPPSPHFPNTSSDQQSELASSSASLSSLSSSFQTQTNYPSRHVHGPSENATGSSLAPLTNRSQGDRSRDDPYMEESEDESTGRVGRYQIETTLGVGAFSRVALASERKTSSTRGSQVPDGLVALKMIEREPCNQNERMRVSWVREVEVLKHIVHSNIVRFLSAFSTPKHHILILERVAGGELFDLLSNRHEELAQREWLVRILFGELANAVGWMHSINLVHRDIKLENIILTHQLFSVDKLRPSTLPASPLLKISDFGLSRFVDPASPLLDTRCGSEEYAAPELIIGKRYDGRKTDVWALGVVLYALLSGSLPFLSTSDQEDQNGVRGYSRERGVAEQGTLARKAHLLRIAKGDLRWPSQTNEASLDLVEAPCPANHRLITPLARRLVAKLIRRDAAKRVSAWEAWDEDWLKKGSLSNESSAGEESVPVPLDPRSPAGQEWLNKNARVQSGAMDLTHDD